MTPDTPRARPSGPPALGAGGNAEGGSAADMLAHANATTCLNCGAVLPGHYCPACGQRDQPIRQPAHVFIAESVSEYFGLDGRLWRSFGLLLFRPGLLTEAYLEGRRTRYLRPLRLYLTATVLFFFLLSLLDPLQGERRSVRLEPVAADSTLPAGALETRLDERGDVFTAEREAVLSAAALLPGVAHGDSLRALAGDLGRMDSLLAVWEDSLEALPGDSLVAVAMLPASVAGALRDTGRVEIESDGPTFSGGVVEQVPEWAKGDLARRLEQTESPTERRMLSEAYQRAVLRQIPTALFLVLPLFALLLKGVYLTGAGRTPRHRPRPAAPHEGARSWSRAAHRIAVGWWAVGRWRERRRVRKRRRALRLARTRPIRGALGRGWRALWAHPVLRPWRIRRLRALRKAVRGARSPYYSEHLVFGLHVHAFVFLVGAALLLTGMADATDGDRESQLQLLLSLSIPGYFLLALKRVYLESWPRTLGKAFLIVVSYTMIVAGGTLLAAALALRLG